MHPANDLEQGANDETFIMKDESILKIMGLERQPYLAQDDPKGKYVHLFVVFLSFHHLWSHPIGIAYYCISFLALKFLAAPFSIKAMIIALMMIINYPRQSKICHDHSPILRLGGGKKKHRALDIVVYKEQNSGSDHCF